MGYPYTESTSSRERIELRCQEMVLDMKVHRPMSARSRGILLMFIAFGAEPGTCTMQGIARLGDVSDAVLKRAWPELKSFFTEIEPGKFVFNQLDWAARYVVPTRQERPTLRHFFRKLVNYWGRACVYCGNNQERLAIEHIVPVARGGAHEIENLTLACRRCNSRKGTKTAAEFGHPHIHDKAQRIQ